MLFGIKAGGFVPGVALGVTNHPDVAHLVAGCNNLLMVKAVSDKAGRALNALVNIVADKAGTEALGLIKLIVIDLGLRMMVRGIA